MKERLKTFMEERNQSEELKEGQIIELLSCFQDADTEKENQFIMYFGDESPAIWDR